MLQKTKDQLDNAVANEVTHQLAIQDRDKETEEKMTLINIETKNQLAEAF